MSSLASEVSEVERQDPNQQDLHIMDEAFVLDDIPTEAVPTISTPVTLVSRPQPLADISLADIDRC